MNEAECAEVFGQVGKFPVTLKTDVATAVCVVSAIQLACRHEAYTGPAREIVENFARQVAAHLGTLRPEIEEMLELGWRPEFDVPCDPSRKCRVCGCTQEHACPGGCHWVEENLCSACEPAVRSLILP